MDARLAARHFCPPERNFERHEAFVGEIRNVWKSETCCLVDCSKCGFGYTDPHLGGNESFYSLLHDQMGYPVDRWEFGMVRNFVNQHNIKGKVLDWGAGAGAFLSSLHSEVKKYAIESSDATIQKLEHKNIMTFKSSHDLLKTHAGSFQLICFFQVLEHIANFKQCISEAIELLNKGGFLAFSVPNATVLRYYNRITDTIDMPPNHINRWTETSIRETLQQMRMELIKIEKEPKSITKVSGLLHLYVIGKCYRKGSWISHAYGIKNTRLRHLVQTTLSILAFPKILSSYRSQPSGLAICAIARKAE